MAAGCRSRYAGRSAAAAVAGLTRRVPRLRAWRATAAARVLRVLEAGDKARVHIREGMCHVAIAEGGRAALNMPVVRPQTFGGIGIVYAGLHCQVARYRGAHDYYNGGIAGTQPVCARPATCL